MKHVIVDLDGTLSDHGHRVHLVTQKPKNYDKYYRGCVDDPPIPKVVAAVNELYDQGCSIHIITGRSDIVRQETIAWLERHGVKYHTLDMRKRNDYRKDTVLKTEIASRLNLTKDNTLCAFDDRDHIVDMWRAMGIECFHVINGELQ